jgi:hypothetical protein
MSANICIGGQLPPSRIPDLLRAICDAGVSLEWGDAVFRPATGEELLAKLEEGQIWLCDEESHGEFPELEATCRKLGLPYTRYAEGGVETDAELVDWRPGMRKALTRIASNCDQSTAYVTTKDVERALKHLKAGRTEQARRILERLCPVIPALPPFEIVASKLT